VNPTSRRTQQRWFICFLVFLATAIVYSDRQFLSLLKSTLTEQIHWTDSQFGLVSSCFLGAYAIGLLFFGWYIDRVGVKIGYATSIFFWSLAALTHTLVNSVEGFLLARVFLGLSEAGNFPAAVKAIAMWFPKTERAFATALFNSGANVGAIGAPLLVAWLLQHWTWHAPFYIAGVSGFIWIVIWWIYYSVPQQNKGVSAAELAWIETDQSTLEEEATTRVPWTTLLGCRQTWSFFVAKFMTDPVWFFLLIWLPDYFKKTRGLDIKSSWPHLMTIYVIVTILSLLGGWMTGHLAKGGWSISRARKTGMFCSALCVLPVLAVGQAGDWTAVCLIGLAGAAHQAWMANLYTSVSDMFPKRAIGTIIGVGSTAGSIGSMIFIYLCGRVLQSFGENGGQAGYHLLFAYCSCAYLFAFLFNHLLAPKFVPVNLDE
jgi:MFS transporter, ACS family, hexuronate transporter